MPNLKGLDSPFEGYVGEAKGRGESSNKESQISNIPIPPATATPSRGAQVNLFTVKPKAKDRSVSDLDSLTFHK